MGGFVEYLPAIAMIGLQCTYAAMALLTREAMLQGMSATVFVFYRQAIASILIVPFTYFSKRNSTTGSSSMGFKAFLLIFFASLIGVTLNQNLYFEGIYLASSSIASAMNNLIPAVTFVLAYLFGLEKINIRKLRSIAKIAGTVLCVSGAICMALLRGPTLLNTSILGAENWLLGCACLFASCCCWSTWLILQVSILQSHAAPDHLSISAWMCFMSTIQSGIVALCIERDLSAWDMFSTLDIVSYLVSGIGGSAIAFFLQAWCISVRGPVFSAMFNPVCTVVTTVLAAIILKEKIYAGSLAGSVGVIIGLYVVLWGKAKDLQENQDLKTAPTDQPPTLQVLIDDNANSEIREPLLAHRLDN